MNPHLMTMADIDMMYSKIDVMIEDLITRFADGEHLSYKQALQFISNRFHYKYQPLLWE